MPFPDAFFKFPKMLLRIKQSLLLALVAGMLVPLVTQASGLSDTTRQERTLSFYNTHTQETLTASYWRNGRYVSASMEDLNRFLRDHRSGHSHTMSADLMNLLHDIKTELKRRHPEKEIVFHVISGYRSPATNAMLRAGGGGQAKKSRHMSGDAIDIRVPGIDTAEIRNLAWCMQRGGVGYYSGSDFVHVDTHKVRHWNWSPKSGLCNRTTS